MKVHVTCVTNHRQDSVARMAQQMIADVGRQLGYEVCPIYTKYTTPHQEPDSLEELLKRLDDLGKKTAAGDAVIFQFPTWNHYTDVFEKTSVTGVLAASVFHYGEIEIPRL